MNGSMNSQMLNNVNTDNLLAEALANFNTSYIVDVVRNSINIRFRPYNTPLPTLNSVEMNFQNLLQSFTDRDHQSQIYEVRRRTYDEIIYTVCQYYQLQYTPNDDVDNYTVAYFLYNVLVSSFTDTFIGFYVNYIFDHQDDIIQGFHLQDSKEAYDTYSKKIYGSASKLGLIHSQIGKVIDGISSLDIRFEDILKYGSGDPQAILTIMNTIVDTGDIFRLRFVPYLMDIGCRTDIITNVKLALQKFATADINIVAPVKE